MSHVRARLRGSHAREEDALCVSRDAQTPTARTRHDELQRHSGQLQAHAIRGLRVRALVVEMCIFLDI